VAEGHLETVLGEYTLAGDLPVYAAVLTQRHRDPKIRATIAFLEECFTRFR
jgi:DNA-binding transcriptional LysR family regulator